MLEDKKSTIIIFLLGCLFLGLSFFSTKESEKNPVGTAPYVQTVPQGGSGWGNIESGAIIYGNGTGKLATSSGLSYDGTRLTTNYASTTALSTTNLTVSGIVSTTDLIVSGTCTGCGSSSAFSWTPTADGNSTSTRLIFGNGFISQASSTVSSALNVTGLLTAPYASTTGLTVTGTASTTALIVGASFVADTVDIQFNECSTANCGLHLQTASVIDVHTPSQFRVSINNDAQLYDFQSTQFLPSPNATNKLGAFGYAWNGVYASSTSYIDNIIALNATTTSFSITGLLNIGGDYLNELCGTGLTCTGNALATSLGTSVDISSETNLAATWPVILTNDTLSWGGLSTSTAAVIGNIPYFSGVNTFDNVATTSVTIGSGLSYSGTFGSVVGGVAGSLTLNATGDWTGTIDGNNFAGGAIGLGDTLYGSGAGVISELAPSTNGFVYALSSGIPAWVASTTLSTISGTLDISAQSNLAVTAPVVLTGDTLSLGNVSAYPTFTYATSTTWTGTTTIPLGLAYVAETWNGVKCFTDVGTLNVVFSDGTNNMDLLNASTTVGTFTLSTNNSFTASEKRYVDVGTPASAPKKISCTVKKTLSIN